MFWSTALVLPIHVYFMLFISFTYNSWILAQLEAAAVVLLLSSALSFIMFISPLLHEADPHNQRRYVW